MAIIKPAPMVSEISGSIGNVTFSSWRGKPYIKMKAPAVTNPNTPQQTAWREQIAELAGLWRGLEQDEKAAWDAAAAQIAGGQQAQLDAMTGTHGGNSRFSPASLPPGPTSNGVLSGQSLFVRTNIGRTPNEPGPFDGIKSAGIAPLSGSILYPANWEPGNPMPLVRTPPSPSAETWAMNPASPIAAAPTWDPGTGTLSVTITAPFNYGVDDTFTGSIDGNRGSVEVYLTHGDPVSNRLGTLHLAENFTDTLNATTFNDRGTERPLTDFPVGTTLRVHARSRSSFGTISDWAFAGPVEITAPPPP